MNEAEILMEHGVTASDEAVKAMQECAKQEAIAFEEWVSDNGWIKDPFPTTKFDDDICRYTNIVTLDESVGDELKMLTIEELYKLFKINTK